MLKDLLNPFRLQRRLEPINILSIFRSNLLVALRSQLSAVELAKLAQFLGRKGTFEEGGEMVVLKAKGDGFRAVVLRASGVEGRDRPDHIIII